MSVGTSLVPRLHSTAFLTLSCGVEPGNEAMYPMGTYDLGRGVDPQYAYANHMDGKTLRG